MKNQLVCFHALHSICEKHLATFVLNWRSFCVSLIGIFLVIQANAQTQSQVPGLVITLSASASNRIELRKALEAESLPRLEKYQKDGLFESFCLLFSRYADTAQWDAMLILNFKDSSQMGRWKAIESVNPAGLGAHTVQLLNSIQAAPVELLRREQDQVAPTKPVVLVIPYLSLVSATDYLNYADGYVIPQFSGWIKETMLSKFSLYGSSFPASRPWSHLIIQEYRSDESLAMRSLIVSKVRTQLREIPQWRALSDSKVKLREELRAVIADDLALESKNVR